MESSESKKSGWGGRRPGAGRKSTGVKYYGFRAWKEVYDIIESVDGPKSDFINQCIIKASKL